MVIENSQQHQVAHLTVEQALHKAIVCHQSGQLQDAERLFRNILLTSPNHPAANHNLGVLLVQLRRFGAALPFLKVALEAEPDEGQHWLSYISALAESGQNHAAHQVLEQGQQRGLQGKMVEALSNMLETRLVDEPTAQEKKELETLLNSGCYVEAESFACDITLRFHENGFGWKMLGASLQLQGRFVEALAPTKKAVDLMPSDVAAHNNLGIILKELGRLPEAEQSYRRALDIDSAYALAHNNLGVTLREQGRLHEAEVTYRCAINISPDYAEAHNNMGNILTELARFEEAKIYYQRAVAIKSNYAEALLNLGHLHVVMCDLNQASISYQGTFDIDPHNFGLDAKVYQAILHYLEDNFEQCRSQLTASHAIINKSDYRYQNAIRYWFYLDNLLNWQFKFGNVGSKKCSSGTLYVIGESHSLSAHGIVVPFKGQKIRCTSEWIAGCKQWHLGSDKANKFKHRFELIMARLPHGSKVLLMIGEIDCRHNEGIIRAFGRQKDKTLDELIRITVDRYLTYARMISARYRHQVIIGGVPCTNLLPKEMAASEFSQLVYVIKTLNTMLKASTLAVGMNFLDIHSLTDRGDGIANGEWHIDKTHLLPSAVEVAFEKYCF